jgi:hypothetical protein
MPIPGVSVLVKGTNLTQTDFDGNMQLKPSKSNFNFSYIGMKTQSMAATSTL